MVADVEMLAHAEPRGLVRYVVLGVSSASTLGEISSLAEACRKYQVNVIRVLGCRVNAGLVSWASENRFRLGVGSSGPRRIVAASPSSGVLSRGDSESVLVWLWRASCRRALTAWHTVRSSEHASYALVSEYQQAGRRYTDKMGRILKYHPAWPALSFLSVSPGPDACRLLAEIGDPRWFADVMRPSRCSRLMKYMGMSPRNIEGWIEERPGDEQAERAKLVMETWRKSASRSHDNFLFPVMMSRDDPVDGVLLASRRFLVFVKQVWLDDPFDPRLFFKNSHEISTWLDHLSVHSFAPKIP